MKQLTDTTWQSDNELITFIQGDCMDFMAGASSSGGFGTTHLSKYRK